MPPKVAIIHPRLIEGGGSEAGALWFLEALKDDYDAYLITMSRVDFKRLNECYGTNISPKQITIIQIPIPYLLKKRFDALRNYRLTRFCKKIASHFDLMISTYNIMDFGKKGIQCIADFSFDDRLRRAFDPTFKGLKGLFYKKSLFRWSYLKVGEILSGASKNGWKRNLTIANSDWTARIMREVFGVQTITLYHPVHSEFPVFPWEKRENGFVILARLSPEKQIERIIDIVERVRKRGFKIHLHILGRIGDSHYIMNLMRICEKNRDWIFTEGLMTGHRKWEFLAQHKFGISGRENEPFGIAVAELVKAGCIVWVPNGGGQLEIVNQSMLIFDDSEDAVNKIELVLKNETFQISLREKLVQQAKKFSAEEFVSKIKKLVPEFLNESQKSL